ncbi:hypothetical protein F5Y06DRAFT_298365 [Hypoxylon sp. FL0890]|nr:hypothetical protein F5Y06DRAFT_298365 [Hypoxylon sp. FL0890]
MFGIHQIREERVRNERILAARERSMDRREEVLELREEEMCLKEETAREKRVSDDADIDNMATMLSRQWTDPHEEWWVIRPASEWKLRKGASAAQVSALEKVLGDVELPRDYKAFLRLVDGTEYFWYRGEDNILFSDFSRVAWETEDVEQNDDLFLSSIIGRAALNDIHRERDYSNTPASLAIRLLQIDDSRRVFLVDPTACRQIAQLWWDVLFQPAISDSVRQKAIQYSASHFGDIPPFYAMMQAYWHTWVVLDTSQKGTRETRLYPSFTDFLDEIATREKIEGTRDWEPEPKAIRKARFAASDRRRWEPVIRSYFNRTV